MDHAIHGSMQAPPLSMLKQRANISPERNALWFEQQGIWTSLSYAQLQQEVLQVAEGLSKLCEGAWVNHQKAINIRQVPRLYRSRLTLAAFHLGWDVMADGADDSAFEVRDTHLSLWKGWKRHKGCVGEPEASSVLCLTHPEGSRWTQDQVSHHAQKECLKHELDFRKKIWVQNDAEALLWEVGAILRAGASAILTEGVSNEPHPEWTVI